VVRKARLESRRDRVRVGTRHHLLAPRSLVLELNPQGIMSRTMDPIMATDTAGLTGCLAESIIQLVQMCS
jgi:hypothetical protein